MNYYVMTSYPVGKRMAWSAQSKWGTFGEASTERLMLIERCNLREEEMVRLVKAKTELEAEKIALGEEELEP